MKKSIKLLCGAMVLMCVAFSTGCSGESNSNTTEANKENTTSESKSAINIANDYGYSIVVADKNGEAVFSAGDTIQEFVPSTAFKAITSAILLDSGVVKKDDKLTEDVTKGIQCATHNENTEETLGEAIKNGCLPLFMEYGEKVDKNVIRDYCTKFGFNDNVGDNENWSIGQGEKVTVEQLARAYSIFANDGKDSKGQEAVTAETANTVRDYLKEDNGLFGAYADRVSGTTTQCYAGILGDKVVVIVNDNYADGFKAVVSEILEDIQQ